MIDVHGRKHFHQRFLLSTSLPPVTHSRLNDHLAHPPYLLVVKQQEQEIRIPIDEAHEDEISESDRIRQLVVT
eukprot:749300-Hanusia_phi.AAC.6